MMKPIQLAFLAAALDLGLSAQAMAHTVYKDLDATNPSPAIVTGNHGWADGADADLGDSHQLVYFKFKVANQSLVKIKVSTVAQTAGNNTAPAQLDPAFTLYKGLLPLLSHDETVIDPLNPVDDNDNPIVHPKDSAYWDSLTKIREGQFDALGTWSMGNDAGDWTEVEYIGHKNDHVGSGTTPDTSPEVLETELAPGDYMIVVGGGLCSTCATSRFFGAEVALTVTPMEGPGSVADECSGTTKKAKPELDSVEAEWSVASGEELSIPLSAHDCNSDALSFTVAKRPKGAKLSASAYESRTQKWASQFTWTPTAKQVGKTYTVSFKAKEKGGGKQSSKAAKVKIKVTAATSGLQAAGNLIISRAQWQAEASQLVVSGKLSNTSPLSGNSLDISSASGSLMLLNGQTPLAAEVEFSPSGNWSAKVSLPEYAVPCEITAQFGGRESSRSVKRAPAQCLP